MNEKVLPSAVRRQRRARLGRLQQRRAALFMLRNGYDRAEVMRSVDIDAPTLARIERSIAGVLVPMVPSVEEMILAASIDDHDRTHLIERLAGFSYDPSVPENAPVALDDALRDGLLTPDEYERIAVIRAAVRRAQIEGWRTPVSIAPDLGAALRESDDGWALAAIHGIAADLRIVLRSARDLADAWDAEPPMFVWSGHRTTRPWDTMLSAFVAHEFERYGDTPPAWSTSSAYDLDTDWYPAEASVEEQEELRQSTPSWLARRRLYPAPEHVE